MADSEEASVDTEASVDDLVDRMRDKLLDLKREILQHLADEDTLARGALGNLDPKDRADVATEDMDRKTLQTLGAQEVRRLNLIQSALARIETGHYGACMRCGSRLPDERLEALPYALFCVPCQSTEERRNR